MTIHAKIVWRERKKYLFGWICQRFSVSKCLHQSFRPHCSHNGFRAWQVYRPCSISQWWAMESNSEGMCCMRIFSVSSGDLELLVRPRRLETRNTWVSTGMAGLSKAQMSSTLAVFRPTPGNVSNSSMVDGMTPPKSETTFWAMPTMDLALLLG